MSAPRLLGGERTASSAPPTSVLSELLRAAPHAAVVAWVAAQPVESVFVSWVTEAEICLGARLLPTSKRRQALERTVEAMFAEDFAGQIRPFETVAVPGYVEIVAKRRAAGRPMSQFDAQIAAIALCHNDRLATRNVSDFAGCGISVVDPWVFARQVLLAGTDPTLAAASAKGKGTTEPPWQQRCGKW